MPLDNDITAFKLDSLSRKLEDVSQKVNNIDDAIRGNGKPGIVLQLAQVRRDIEELRYKTEQVILEQEQAKAERQAHQEEISSLMNKARGILIGVGLAGATGGGGIVLLIKGLLGGP